MLRRFHRVLGVVLVAPFVLWTSTGLLFLVKPGWRGAYEMLTPFRDEPVDRVALRPLAEIPGDVVRAELVTTAIGPLWRIDGGETSRLVDARTGIVLSPLVLDSAQRVVVDAASRAKAPSRYGDVVVTRDDGATIEFDFAGGATVVLDRNDLSLSQSGTDTARIDLLYRVHYLQWTGVAAIDRPLAVLAIVATWALAALGVSLLRRRAA